MKTTLILQHAGLIVAVLVQTAFGRKVTRGRCLQPPQMQNRNEYCPTPFVPETICHSGTTCHGPHGDQDGSDVCSVVAHALLADFEIFDVVFLHGELCQREIRAGEMTRADAERVLPFNEELVHIQLNGSDILAALEHGFDAYHFQHIQETFPSAAGIRFQIDLTRPYGSRILRPEIFNAKCKWKPLILHMKYHVLVTESLAYGGSYDYAALTRGKAKAGSGVGLTDAFWFYSQNVCIVRDPFKPKPPKKGSKKQKKQKTASTAPLIQLKSGNKKVNRTVSAVM